ncbi:hypothetical protein BJV82DRAFT_606837 [Fennellomyces sp. T-0311]|nr:hypothetical protein BJV82DRAFT_606837 [Fennellomyces sp. T-0311]
MRIYPTHKKYPCKACRFIRKKCTWRDKTTKECDRCVMKDIECVPVYDTTELYLYMAENGDKEVQELWDIIDELDSSMRQLDAAKADLEQRLINKAQQPLSEWKLSITNGTLQLETPIQTMDELSMFTQASIKYLSPFSGLFKKQPVRFECRVITVSLGIPTVIHRRELIKPRRKRFNNYTIDCNSDSEVPSLNHRAIINHLIALYFEHYIPYVGLLHVPTFLDHYSSVDDPMDSALVLAVCVDALIVTRNHLIYTPNEICALIETFYDRCRDLLFDMYDDPDRKLDVIITTSLLQQYTSDVLLNYREANHLVTVALLVCGDLLKERDELSPVEWMLLQRNHFHLQMFSQFFNMMFEHKVDFTLPMSMGRMVVLDDEPEKTKGCILLINEVFRLFGSEYISSTLGKISNVFYTRYCDVFIEEIMQYEPVIKEWWTSLPPQFRLCDDPFDPEAYKLFKYSVPANYLIPFTVLHVLTGVITSSILQPHIVQTSENTVTMDAIQLVRSKLISLALNSCKTLVYLLKENWNPSVCIMPTFGLTIMNYTIYCLEKLSSCDATPFPTELLGIVKKSLSAMSKSLIPAGHEVHSRSPLLMAYLEKPENSPFEIYEQYPLPGFVMTWDILFSSVNLLAEQHLTANF